MDHTFWHKQTVEQPLFPDLLWSRPEHKAQAGKLLIIGGNAHGFAAVAEAFSSATQAGVGTVRVLLPDCLQKTIGRGLAIGEYAPSTPSGSFAGQALDELLAASAWADATLLAGDLGHNSETAVLLEKFITKYTGQLVLVQDSVDYFGAQATLALSRADTLLVTSFAQLQKLAGNIRFPQAFTSSMDLLRFIDGLHNLTQQQAASIIVKHLDNLVVAVDGRVSTTKLAATSANWPGGTAAQAAVWWLQNPTKTFEALTTSLL